MFFQNGKWNLHICLRTRKNLNSSLLTMLHHFICSQDVLSDSIVWSLFLFHTVGYLYSGEGQGFFLAGEGQTIQISKCTVLFILLYDFECINTEFWELGNEGKKRWILMKMVIVFVCFSWLAQRLFGRPLNNKLQIINFKPLCLIQW